MQIIEAHTPMQPAGIRTVNEIEDAKRPRLHGIKVQLPRVITALFQNELNYLETSRERKRKKKTMLE